MKTEARLRAVKLQGRDLKDCGSHRGQRSQPGEALLSALRGGTGDSGLQNRENKCLVLRVPHCGHLFLQL